ncbi:MAG TPA: hypothetical protein PLW81_15975 [Thiobacillaceae bacterium]|nr:hypothetical protein [Thiobacillaceae bacterium]
MRYLSWVLLGLATTQAYAGLNSSDEICPRGRLNADDLSQVQSVQPADHAPLRLEGPVAHYGQLGAEDLSQMASVRPSPNTPLGISGIAGCHRGQLSQEDLSFVKSVQPDLRVLEAGAPAADSE